jgi:hypothetical protein
LSFKRKQVQQKPLSKFISHLYSLPNRQPTPQQEQQQRRRPTIQIPASSPNELDILPASEVDETQDLAEQGYGKEMLGEWVSEAGVGARKYDDLTAIGPQSYR